MLHLQYLHDCEFINRCHQPTRSHWSSAACCSCSYIFCAPAVHTSYLHGSSLRTWSTSPGQSYQSCINTPKTYSNWAFPYIGIGLFSNQNLFAGRFSSACLFTRRHFLFVRIPTVHLRRANWACWPASAALPDWAATSVANDQALVKRWVLKSKWKSERY